MAAPAGVGIEAVFEAPWFEGQAPWPWAIAAVSPYQLVRLRPDASAEVVGAFVAAMLQDNSLDASDTVESTLEVLMGESDLILSGGLRIVGADGTEIGPSCCCGLESWREWEELFRSGNTPWLGHDPSPYAERIEGVVRIWADRPDATVSSGAYLDIDEVAFRRDLDRVHADMVAFLDRLSEWAVALGFSRSTELAQHVARELSLGLP